MKTEELLELWKPILDYSSKNIDPIPEHKKLYVALKLQEWDARCVNWAKDGICNEYFAKNVIPQVRQAMGDIKTYDEVVDGRFCLVIENAHLFSVKRKLAVPYLPYGLVPFMGELYFDVDGKWVKNLKLED